MFEVQKHKLGRFEAVRLVNKHTHEYLEVLSDFGAGINDFVVVNAKGQTCSVIDGYRSEEEIWHDHHVRFKGSKLSPFPNRVHGGKYSFGGKNYQLPINEVKAGNNLHAFLHHRPFEIVSESADHDSANLKLKHQYRGTEKGYPFSYDIILNFEIKVDGVTVDTEITSTSDRDIPIGDGWHPYFKFPDINKVELQMDEVNRVASNRGNKLAIGIDYKESGLIGKDDWDDCFEIRDNDCFTLKLKDKKTGVELVWWQESAKGKYQFLQLYTPPDRKSIAIEPVTCMPDGFNSGRGLKILKPNETMSMSFGIKNIRQTN